MAPFVEADGSARSRVPSGGPAAGAALGQTQRGAPADDVTVELTEVLARLGELTRADVRGSDAARIDRIALLERVKAAAGAAEGAEMVRFAKSQVAAQEQIVGLDPRAVGRGIADQIALVCKVSPSEGSRRLGVARALHVELPAVGELLGSGEISEYVAGLVVTETRHLDPVLRGRVDEELVAAGIAELSPRRAAALARKLAYEADPAGYLARGRTAREDRRVSLRPAPDTMTNLSAFLPVEQGVACWAALKRHTDTLIGTGDDRTRDQIMADTLVERLTGQTTAADVGVEVQIVVPVEALLDPDSPRTADIPGHGPLPARLARDIISGTAGRRWWRRLFTAPAAGPVTVHPTTTGPTGPIDPTSRTSRTGPTGPIVGGDPRRRRFDGWLADLIGARDGGRCRDPFCDAPIRHIDHIIRFRDGGPTSLINGRGVCARGNYVREMPGWTVETVEDGLGGRPHTVRTTTPTGHVYVSRAPRPP